MATHGRKNETMDKPCEFSVTLATSKASEMRDNTAGGPLTTSEIREGTVNARRQFVEWLTQLDPSARVAPPESAWCFSPVFYVKSTAEVLRLLLATETRPSVVADVEPRESPVLAFSMTL
jgi:hypothetical protein